MPDNQQPNDPEGRVRDSQTYEMLWDCKSCGSKKLLAKTHQFCPSCGASQDPSWRYFPSDSEKVLAKDHVFVGADVVCPACGTLNAGNVGFCRRCGSPLAEGEKAKQQSTRRAGLTAQLDTEDLYARQDTEAAVAVSGISPATQSTGGIKRWQIGLIAVVVLLIGGGLFTAFSTQEATAVVTDLRWEREIHVERLSAVDDSSLCSSMPADAYSVDRRYEQVSSRQVPDGETCTRRQVDQGDGTFREENVCTTKYRDEPVYDYQCYYTINRWVSVQSLATNGDKLVQPFWSDAHLRGGSRLGAERESGRTERYLLVLKRDQKSFECTVDADVWNSTSIESVWTIQVGRVLNDERCDTLKPAN